MSSAPARERQDARWPDTVVPPENPVFCHTQPYPGALTLCGCKGSGPGDPLHDGEYIDGRCTGCGKKACKTCEIMEWPL